MKKSRLLCVVCASIFGFISMSSHAALVDNGGGLFYDTVLNITWAQPDAERTWDNANTWAAGLTLGGVSGWRLPYLSVAVGADPLTRNPINCRSATELACRDNELGYMFFHNLSGNPDLAPFPTLLSKNQWSGSWDDSHYAWIFYEGFQGVGRKEIYEFYSLAVHSGNVGAVPIPSAVWLFGTGLLGLVGIARRKKA